MGIGRRGRWRNGAGICRRSVGELRRKSAPPLLLRLRRTSGSGGVLPARFDARDGGFAKTAHGMGEDAVENLIRIEEAGFQTQA